MNGQVFTSAIQVSFVLTDHRDDFGRLQINAVNGHDLLSTLGWGETSVPYWDLRWRASHGSWLITEPFLGIGKVLGWKAEIGLGCAHSGRVNRARVILPQPLLKPDSGPTPTRPPFGHWVRSTNRSLGPGGGTRFWMLCKLAC